jgi:glucose-1-phosphate thymidylyltransferase
VKPTAIIPIAGEGTRLRPHTYSRPKVLIDVAGKPMISHILDRLVEVGITDAVFVVGHMGGDVRDFIEREYDFNASYVEQPERKGLGHAVYLARERVRPGPVLIVLGDTLFRADLSGVINGDVSRIAVMETDDPSRFGIAELDGDRVVRVVEKPSDPPSNLAVIGIYYLTNSEVLFDCLHHIVKNDIKTKGEYQLTDALAVMTERGETLGVFVVDGWYDCGKKETLLQTNRELLNAQGGAPSIEGSTVIAPVAVHPSANVKGSVVGPHVSIGAGVSVEGSVVRDSIICEGSKVVDAVLEGSLIGRRCRVTGAGVALDVGDDSEADLR